MLKNPLEALTLSKVHDIPPEDILFLDFSLSGVTVNYPYARVRFEFTPQKKPYFKTSFQRNIPKYFFALPVNPVSDYRIENNYLISKDEVVGEVKGLANDTCDSSYPRRGGTVLNLNPVSKSQCRGCRFCHTLLQDAKDREENLQSESALTHFIIEWLKRYKASDLSRLIQVAIVTGCSGSEQKVVNSLKIVRKVLNKYGFTKELFYFGSEITTEKSLDEVKELKPFALCLSWEIFKNREKIVRDIKDRVTIKTAKKILGGAKKRGFRTNFSYILGLESLETMRKGFEELIPYINSFPVINVFQIHRGQDKLRYSKAWEIDYYIKARKMVEKMFVNTDMRPRVWENYRSLWYLNFANEELSDFRTP